MRFRYCFLLFLVVMLFTFGCSRNQTENDAFKELQLSEDSNTEESEEELKENSGEKTKVSAMFMPFL